MNCSIFVLEDNVNRMAVLYRLLPRKFPGVEIVHTEFVEEAKKLIVQKSYWDIVLLDHDLGGQTYVDSDEEDTGYQFLKFFKEKNIQCGQLIYHTQNPAGGANMCSLIPKGQHIPFPNLVDLLTSQ